MIMLLPALLAGSDVSRSLPPAWSGVGIGGLSYHSGRVQRGDLFAALAGHNTDGNRYALDAVTAGAAAVLSESPAPEGFPVPWIVSANARRTLAIACSNFYREAAATIRVTGATGTNGKTTTCLLFDTILRHAGHTTALIGTVNYHVAGELRAAVNTTPESVDFYGVLRDLHRTGGTHLITEVSSHALALGRVWAVRFHTAIFTNLTRDHLDFHGDMQAYGAAKEELAKGQGVPPPAWIVTNNDDPWARNLGDPAVQQVIRYGLEPGADLRAADLQASFQGLRFDLEWQGRTTPVVSPLTGRVNAYNVLAACGAALSHGLDPEQIAAGVAACVTVPGRFERVDAGQPFLVAVDYAHTDDALRNVGRTARQLASGRVLMLFGCGGDRDRSKRPLMGRAAGESADWVMLTSDNPRSEDPLEIIAQARPGLEETGTPFAVEPDRRAAIRAIVAEARPGDVVVLAGKGHETYQVLKGRSVDFDDRAEARAALLDLGYEGAA